MKRGNKTIVASLLFFFFGASCCWLTALAAWFGGLAFAATVAQFSGSIQITFITIGIVFLLITGYRFWKRKS